MTNDYDKASEFTPLPGEATFPPPITIEVKGGCHIAPECLTILDGQFIMIDWPQGLARHDTSRTVRFPHGLMLFGETIEQTASRLVSQQLGMAVTRVRVLKIYSYVDEANHWHIEPLLEVKVEGPSRLPAEATGIVRFWGRTMPAGSVWSDGSFEAMFDEFYGQDT